MEKDGGWGSPVALPCCYGHQLSREPASATLTGISLGNIQRDAVAYTYTGAYIDGDAAL